MGHTPKGCRSIEARAFARSCNIGSSLTNRRNSCGSILSLPMCRRSSCSLSSTTRSPACARAACKQQQQRPDNETRSNTMGHLMTRGGCSGTINTLWSSPANQNAVALRKRMWTPLMASHHGATLLPSRTSSQSYRAQPSGGTTRAGQHAPLGGTRRAGQTMTRQMELQAPRLPENAAHEKAARSERHARTQRLPESRFVAPHIHMVLS